jgi:epoxyqueuosine reductase
VASHPEPGIATNIIEKARSSGASSAGITSIASLQNSPSYEIYGKVEWPQGAKSVVVLALVHKAAEPQLDWWDAEGDSLGNRKLESIAKALRESLKEELNTTAHLLPYHVGKGGIFLKDAAVLSGLGIIGMNNLLVTAEFGPRVRLRALCLDVEVEPTGPSDFAPCKTCDMHCRQACPQEAFKNGTYKRVLCNKQMKIDEANRVTAYIKYCRACELACPVGTQ